MRHRVDHRKLGRTASHRRALMRSMVTSLFQAERITTTGPKAKEVRRVAERLITRAKKGYRAHQEGASLKASGKEAEARQAESVALAHWRQAGRFVRDTDVLRKLFDTLAPLYLERNGGYTRIIRLGTARLGDNARMVLLELVDSEASKKPLMRGVKVTEAAPEKQEKPAKGGKRGKKAEAAEEGAEAESKTKKDKKARPAKEKTEKKPVKSKGKTSVAKTDPGKAKAKSKSKKSG